MALIDISEIAVWRESTSARLPLTPKVAPRCALDLFEGAYFDLPNPFARNRQFSPELLELWGMFGQAPGHEYPPLPFCQYIQRSMQSICLLRVFIVLRH
jgi:hypothetical protein